MLSRIHDNQVDLDVLGDLDPEDHPFNVLYNEVANMRQAHLQTQSDLNDFMETDMVSSIGIDTLMCANARLFYGSRYSTFTDYINVLRYYNNKIDCSKTLLNYTFTGQEKFSWENSFVEEY